ncbi:hypothetical protein NP233_g2286 [Leucocoprinus birnbaumii]|uniref:F-box domain-containing protein n=1 Tax=Leucocoprinus birnbaumii TaxID=56174 RepID=A0AAD5W4Q3_9AGAR|nr:hypothetical protein NP233_g2286 [Leucocoprinus birnbaumii]
MRLKTTIDGLPSELFIEIIRSVVQAPLDECSDVLPFQFTASNVCRSWKQHIYRVPSLWANVCISPRSTFDLEAFLERSKECLIRLSIIFPDSAPASRFLLQLKTLLPLHSERISELYIYHCDCRRDEVFATIGILSCHPTTNLSVLELLEDYDFYYLFYKRGVTRATPKSGLPWCQNIKHITAPGSWLHMLISAPRPFLTTLQTDDAFVKKKVFKGLVENMPALTTLILRNEHNIYNGDIDSDGPEPIPILIPSLRLLRLEYWYKHRTRPAMSRPFCLCLPSRIVAPNLEVLEASCKTKFNKLNEKSDTKTSDSDSEDLKDSGEVCADVDADPKMDGEAEELDTGSESSVASLEDSEEVEVIVRTPKWPEFPPIRCIMNQHSCDHWNKPFGTLKKIRFENVSAPYELLNQLCQPVDVDFVFDREDLEPDVLQLLPPAFSAFLSTNRLTLDFSGWKEGYTARVLKAIEEIPGLDNLDNLTVCLPLSSAKGFQSRLECLSVRGVTWRVGATNRPSDIQSSRDDLGYLARHEDHIHGAWRREVWHPRHIRLSPKPSVEGMAKVFSDAMCDSDEDTDDEIY